jgi:hypothetical protein
MKLLICAAALVAASGQSAAPPTSRATDQNPPLSTTPVPRKWMLVAQGTDGAKYYIDVWSVRKKSDGIVTGWERQEAREGKFPGATTIFTNYDYDCRNHTSKLLYGEAELTDSKTLGKFYYGENQPWNKPLRGGPREIIIDTVCKALKQFGQ